MAVDDLRYPPPIPYDHLYRSWCASDEAVQFASDKCDRQATFIASLADFIASCPTQIDEENKRFILQCIHEHVQYEIEVIRRRIEEVRRVTRPT